MKVFVYWNLHRGLWSVKALEGPQKGRVVLRTDKVLLADAVGKVSEAGRQRVLREGKKNVHAGIVGVYSYKNYESTVHWDVEAAVEGIGDRITYNPYKFSSFVHTVDSSPYEGSAYAFLTDNRAVYVA